MSAMLCQSCGTTECDIGPKGESRKKCGLNEQIHVAYKLDKVGRYRASCGRKRMMTIDLSEFHPAWPSQGHLFRTLIK